MNSGACCFAYRDSPWLVLEVGELDWWPLVPSALVQSPEDLLRRHWGRGRMTGSGREWSPEMGGGGQGGGGKWGMCRFNWFLIIWARAFKWGKTDLFILPGWQGDPWLFCKSVSQAHESLLMPGFCPALSHKPRKSSFSSFSLWTTLWHESYQAIRFLVRTLPAEEESLCIPQELLSASPRSWASIASQIRAGGILALWLQRAFPWLHHDA